MKLFLTILSALFVTSYFGQMTIGGVAQVNGATVTACGGVVRDHGNTGNYGTNRNDQIVICPSQLGDVIQLTFTDLAIETGVGGDRSCVDLLYIYQSSAPSWTGAGASDIYCGDLAVSSMPTIISTSPDGCVSLQLVSDGGNKGGFTPTGFEATISCVTACKSPSAVIASAATPLTLCSTSLPATANVSGTGSAAALTTDYDADNGNDADLSESVTALAGTRYYSPVGGGPPSGATLPPSITSYQWNWGDNTTSSTAGAAASHSYASYGVYNVTLQVRDNNADHTGGCASSNAASRKVYVVPPPDSVANNLTIACNNASEVTGGAETGSICAAFSTRTVAETPPTIAVSPTLLPDGNGQAYTNCVDYSGYFATGPSDRVRGGALGDCRPTVTFDLEHSWAGDLYIDLVAPNGQYVRLFNRIGGQNKFGNCSNISDTDATGGCPRGYTVSPTAATAWPASGGAGTNDVSAVCANFAGPCEEAGSGALDAIASGTYASSGVWTNIESSTLNGTWCLRITDNQSLDNGMLFNWGITFPAACFKALTEISPAISSVVWSNADNTSTTTALTPAPGDPCPAGATCDGNELENCTTVGPYATAQTVTFIATATDELGCTWTERSTVTVTCVLPVELLEFKGMNTARSIDLTWLVGSEKDNDYYTLMKSKNGIDYEEIGVIDSKVGGNTTEKVSYSFIDDEPVYGVSYYKLYQTDFNGQKKYLDEITVDRSEHFTGLIIIPNPVNESAHILFHSIRSGTNVYKVFDMSGKLIIEGTYESVKGSNEIRLETDQLTNGMFYLEIYNDLDHIRQRFIKN